MVKEEMMGNFEELLPDHVRSMGSYAPGKPLRQAEKESGVHCVKMASNENPLGPSPRAVEAIRQAAADCNFYPDSETSELRVRLAQGAGLEPAQVLVTAGSTAFLNIAARTLLGPGLNAVTSVRSFIVYPVVTHATGAKLVTVPMRDDTFDLDGILQAIDSNTRLVYIANPNNPTGTMLGPAAIERFLSRVPYHVTVILDEAYADFAEYFGRERGEVYSHSFDYIRQNRNLLVLRTFSKAYGLAGLRVGYGFAPTGLMQYFARMRTVFSVSSVGEAAALAALDDKDHLRKAQENNSIGAAWLTEKLAALGLKVKPTWANFLYIETGEDSVGLVKRLQDAGVIVRPLLGWGAPTAIRVTIGTPEQNELFITALKKVLTRVTAP